MNNHFYNEPAEVQATEFDSAAYFRMEKTLEDIGAQLDLTAMDGGVTTLNSFSVTRNSFGYKIKVSVTKTRFIARPR